MHVAHFAYHNIVPNRKCARLFATVI